MKCTLVVVAAVAVVGDVDNKHVDNTSLFPEEVVSCEVKVCSVGDGEVEDGGDGGKLEDVEETLAG